MRKYNKFLTLLLCISLSFLVSCMNEGKSDTDTTEKQPDGILTDAVNTEAPETEVPPETSAVTTLNTEEAPKTDAPQTTPEGPVVTTAQLTTIALPVTTAPVTTPSQPTSPSEPSVEYDDEILLDLMYQTDDDGKWSGFGKYIANYEEIDEVDYLLVLRSQEAYDEANSILNGEADKTITDLYESFKSDIKLILRVHSVEFTEKDVLGYEVIKLQ